ncbi:MAG TPA: glycosyltransferase [Solirubrobacteraceae bacterium]
MIVHQLLSGAGPHDAVTGQALAYRRRFDAWGWGGRDHAATADPRLGRAVRPLHALEAAPTDVLLLHYSAHAPGLAPLLKRPNPKALVFHNVTPARYFWDWDPITAVRCEVGREQLARFAPAVDLAVGVSAYNVAELEAAGARETAVVPILVEPARLGPPGPARAGAGPGPHLLFVGRLAPHKRQDELIRTLALLRAEHATDARLTLVGAPASAAYADGLRALADRLAPGAVTIEHGLSAPELADRYRAADAFVCLSEHEGFCVPLLEAFHFGVPVVARPAGGIAEVAGDAALLTEDADLAVVAELALAAATDAELRGELIARGRARLDEYEPAKVAAALRAALERVASGTWNATKPSGAPPS